MYYSCDIVQINQLKACVSYIYIYTTISICNAVGPQQKLRKYNGDCRFHMKKTVVFDVHFINLYDKICTFKDSVMRVVRL